MMKGIFVALLLCTGAPAVLGRGSGAPESACVDLTPGHTEAAQTSNPPYTLEIVGGATTFTANTKVKVKISGQQYAGFLLQLRKKGETTPLGSFSALPSGTKHVACTTSSSSVTHSSSTAKQTILEYTWNPPNSANGEYEFVATVAQEKAIYWVALKSSTLTANYSTADNAGTFQAGLSPIVVMGMLFVAMLSFLALT